MAETSELLSNESELPEAKTLISWTYESRPQQQRGRLWYVVAGLIGVGLLIYALISANFLFALIIVMVALVMFVSSMFGSDKVEVAVKEDGLQVGRLLFEYRDIAKFWFCYEPPEVGCLYLDFRNAWQPRIRIDLADRNPNDVRQHLLNYIAEDLQKRDEPLGDWVGRLLKM